MKNNITILVKNSEKIEQIKTEILNSYLADKIPWVIAYSGGKDSTMTLQLVLETVAEKPKKEVHILYADTRVEPPPVIDNARKLLRKINVWAKEHDLPVKTKILYPELKNNFFVLMLGKGYLPPTQWFRWCTERLKVRPIKRYIRKLIEKYGSCVVLLGMRLKESSTRDKGLEKRGYSKWMPFEGVKGATIYAPILELSIEDVWTYLLDKNPPWGMDNNLLRCLYTGGNTSCSLFCGGIRFGCWVCTVVSKDRCTEGLAQIPGWDWLDNFLGYRDLMLEIRNKPENRIIRHNNGEAYVGPLNLVARKILFKELRKLEKKIGMSVLNPEDKAEIYALWRKEKILTEKQYVD
jgi:DNA sulfur modification protein DndC